VLNGEAKGAAVDAVVGEVKEAGLAGTEGGAVVVDEVEPALADGEVEAGTAGPDAGKEAMAAGAGDVDAVAVAAIVPPRSHGFGGEVIFQIGRSDAQGYRWVSGFSDRNYGGCDLFPVEHF
jgi:hypothetical protein